MIDGVVWSDWETGDLGGEAGGAVPLPQSAEEMPFFVIRGDEWAAILATESKDEALRELTNTGDGIDHHVWVADERPA